MRYSYYQQKEREPGSRSGALLRYLLYVVTLVIIGLSFTVWNRQPKLDPEDLAREAFYEGYFTLNTRLDQTISLRFPSLRFVEGHISDDGLAIHRFVIEDHDQVRAKDVRRLLESSLEGYGFNVQESRLSDDRWEYQLLSDSTVWSVYIFEAVEEEIQYATLLPDDLRLSRKPAQLAIVIDDFGYALNDVIEGFVRLPQIYTAAVIPGRPYSRQLAEKHNNRKRETLIHMPMITVSNSSSEPELVLADSMDSQEILRRLDLAAQSVPFARGMNNHQGSGATQDPELMRIVAGFLNQREMFLLDSRTIAASVAETVARQSGVQATRRDVFLDEVDDPDAIAKELFRLARIARERGSAIGIGHCRRNTLATLTKYLPALEEAGFELVPVSSLVRG